MSQPAPSVPNPLAAAHESYRRKALGRRLAREEVLTRIYKTPAYPAGPLPSFADGVTMLRPSWVRVLWGLALGLSREEMAAVMCVSLKTVDSHRTALMGAMNIHRTPVLVLWARETLGLPWIREQVRLGGLTQIRLERLPLGVRAAEMLAIAPACPPPVAKEAAA